MTKLTIFAAIALVLATAVYLYSDAIHRADKERARADTLEIIADEKDRVLDDGDVNDSLHELAK